MRIAALLLTLFILTALACSDFAALDDISGTDTQAEFALPLIDTELSVTDILDDFDDNARLEVDAGGLIHLVYTGDVLSRTSDEIFEAVNDAIPPFIPVLSPRMALPFSSPDGIDVDQIIFKTGRIQYTFQSYSDTPMNVEVRIPSLSKAGVPFKQDHVVAAAVGDDPAIPLPPLVEIDLAGYELTAEQDSIYIEYTALRADGRTDTLDNFIMTLSDLQFAYAEGFLGQQSYDTDRDTIAIDFFEEWQGGRVFFENPTIDIRIDNSFGIPTRSVVNAFEVMSATGQTIALASPVLETGIDFNYPSLQEVGTTQTTRFSFTTDNSNVAQVLGSTPVAVIYDVDAATNPDATQTVSGFVTDSSKFSVNVAVDLPLYASAEGFVVTDTLSIDLGNMEKVASANFKIITESTLGLDVALQAYFVDRQGSVIDSLWSEDTFFVKGATVNDEGISMNRSTMTTFVDFSAERFARITDATHLWVRSRFSTLQSGTTSVKIFESDNVQLRMGVRVTPQ